MSDSQIQFGGGTHGLGVNATGLEFGVGFGLDLGNVHAFVA